MLLTGQYIIAPFMTVWMMIMPVRTYAIYLQLYMLRYVTLGPACILSCPAATVFRNYFINGAGQGIIYLHS
jgi:hypothetical protein